MYPGLVHAHSGLRWLALVLLLVAAFVAFRRWQGRDEFTEGNRKLYLYTFIMIHIQLTLGLILYVISPKVNFSMLGEKLYRFYTVEHSVGMLVAITLITLGYIRAKRAAGPVNKHRTVFVFYTIGLILIVASIPWPGRGVAAGLY
ncbi:MAG: cytochrome B [Bacteroidetes bacterium]|nr:cytochrome B [Fibrella sp.]